MLDVKRLQVLLSVVELGSVTAAADALMYTPSAVSQQLRRLEREVGQPLMKRHARGMSPTEAGAGPGAARPQGHAPAGRGRGRPAGDRRAAARPARAGHVPDRRQLVPAAGGAPVPAAAPGDPAGHPQRPRGPARRVAGERHGRPVAAVGLRVARLDPAQLDLTELFDDPTVLVVAADHRLARRRRVAWPSSPTRTGSSALDHPVVEVLQRSAVAAGFEPKVSFRANDYQEAQAMVGVGLGIAAGAADGGAQPDRQRPGHPARHQRCRPAGSSSPTAGTGWTRPPRPHSTSSSSRSARPTSRSEPRVSDCSCCYTALC